MLDTKNKLKECLKREKKYYITGKKRHDQLVEWLVNDPSVRIWKYQKFLDKGNRENRKKILYYGKSYKERCS